MNWINVVFDSAKLSALVAVTFACAEIGIAMHDANSANNATVKSLNTTLTTTNATMSETRAAVHDLRLTLDNVNKAAIDERQYSEQQLPVLTLKINKILDSAQVSVDETHALVNASTQAINQANVTIADLQPTEDQLQKTISNLQPLENQLDQTAIASTEAVNNLNKLIADPTVVATMNNIEASSKSIADATVQVDGTLKDVKVEVDKYVYPPKQKWYQKVYQTAFKAGELLYDFIR